MRPTRDDVVTCYRRVLEREPENEAVVDRLLASEPDFWTLLMKFVNSEEFRARAGRMSAYSLRKSLDPHYLVRGLSPAVRADCAIHNYAVLREALTGDALVALIDDRLPVVEGVPGFPELGVDMRLHHAPAAEGEISLVMTVAGRQVAALSFTIVPGAAFGLAAGPAFLISRLQGYVGVRDDAHAAARRLGDIAPPYLLMAVLEGIALAQGVTRLIGVNALAHPAYAAWRADMLIRAYDDLFRSLGCETLPSGLHLMRVPREGRPIEGITAGHRARTRRKRAIKQAIAEQVRLRWLSHMRPPA